MNDTLQFTMNHYSALLGCLWYSSFNANNHFDTLSSLFHTICWIEITLRYGTLRIINKFIFTYYKPSSRITAGQGPRILSQFICAVSKEK